MKIGFVSGNAPALFCSAICLEAPRHGRRFITVQLKAGAAAFGKFVGPERVKRSSCLSPQGIILDERHQWLTQWAAIQQILASPCRLNKPLCQTVLNSAFAEGEQLPSAGENGQLTDDCPTSTLRQPQKLAPDLRALSAAIPPHR